MFTRNVQFWKEDGWQGRKSKVETWNADTKEDLFLRILTANNKIQKHFDKNKMNGDCWRFLDDDWKLQEEYDKWWANLGIEKQQEIFENA